MPNIIPGTPISADISTAGEVDEYRVDLGADTPVRITLTANGASPLSSSNLVLVTDSGYIAGPSGYFGGFFDRAETGTTVAATYYDVLVGDETENFVTVRVGSNGGGTGTYSISADMIVDDFPEGTDTTGVVAIGAPVSAQMDSGFDSDTFRIAAAAGQTLSYSVTLDERGPNTYRVNAILRDGDGNTLASENLPLNTIGTATRVLTHEAATTEDLFLTISMEGGGGTNYTVSVEETVPDIPNTLATTARVEVGGSVQSEIETPYDIDWFRVSLEAGKTYLIDQEGAPTNKGTLRDTYLNGVLDPTGTTRLTGANDDGGFGLNSLLSFSPVADGDYIIAARAYSRNMGTYTLSVGELTDDFPASTATTGVLTIGTPATGRTDHGFLPGVGYDQDWFRTELDAGTLYRFTAGRADNPDRIWTRPTVALQEGQDGVYTDGSGAGYFVPSETGTYFINVGGFSVGDYVLNGEAVWSGFDAETADLVFASGSSRKGSVRDEIMLGSSSADVIRGVGENDTLLGFEGDDLLVGDETRPATDHDADTAAQVYRAFQFLLGRDPDAVGFDDLADRNWYGDRLMRIIVNGQEFLDRHGEMTNAEFVDFLFDRLRGPGAASAEETDALLNIVNQRGRAEAARVVVDSEEHENSLGGRDMAFMFTDPNPQSHAEVFTLYQAVFGRTPDATGFARWDAAMDNGLSLSGLAERFLGSREFTQAGALSDRAFAETILTNLGDAAPDAGQLDSAEALLAAGLTRADFVAANVIIDRADPTDWIRSRRTDDVLIGGSGDNILIGGGMSDTFVFRQEDAGFHRIMDFETWDRIDLTDFGFADQQAAMDAFSVVGNSMVFTEGEVTILVRNAGPDVLTVDDFLV